MTAKQQAFCDEYLKTMNGTQAYMIAYPTCKRSTVAGSEGYKLLQKPHIQAYIKEKLQEISNKRIATAQETLEFLTAAMRDIETEDQVVVESIGDYMSEARVVKKRIPAKDRISAAITLSRYHKLLENKNEVKEETWEKLDKIMQSLDNQARGTQ